MPLAAWRVGMQRGRTAKIETGSGRLPAIGQGATAGAHSERPVHQSGLTAGRSARSTAAQPDWTSTSW